MIKVSFTEFASWVMSFQENTSRQTVQATVFGVSSKATRKQKIGSGHPEPRSFLAKKQKPRYFGWP